MMSISDAPPGGTGPGDLAQPVSAGQPVQASDLAEAIRSGQLHMVYQPQVSVDGQSIVCMEGLVRWTHPTRGPVAPSVFIPIAEAAGLIDQVFTWTLDRACRDAVSWGVLPIAINVSPLQFRDPSFAKTVFALAGRLDFPLRRLELEITESAIFDDPDQAQVAMEQLRSAGIRLALDDFGTGFTSLSYLRRLPWDKVKIDKAFIDEVEYVPSAAIVHAIVALCRALGLKVTAEGVETLQQHQFLRSAGCHYLQGFYFFRPLTATAVDKLLKERAIGAATAASG